MNNYQLYTQEIWNHSKPGDVEFKTFFQTEKSKEIKKVIGYILIQKVGLINGLKQKIDSKRKAYWDGYGRCYVGTHNIRKRMYDIPLRQYGSINI